MSLHKRPPRKTRKARSPPPDGGPLDEEIEETDVDEAAFTEQSSDALDATELDSEELTSSTPPDDSTVGPPGGPPAMNNSSTEPLIPNYIFPDVRKPDAHGPQDLNQTPTNLEQARLYVAVRVLLRDYFGLHVELPPGNNAKAKVPVDPIDFGGLRAKTTGDGNGEDIERIFFAGVYGLLFASGVTDPTMGRRANAMGPDRRPDGVGPEDILVDDQDLPYYLNPTNFPKVTPTFVIATARSNTPALGYSADEGASYDPELAVPTPLVIVPQFVNAFTAAVQEYNASRALFLAVFKKLEELGTTLTNGGKTPNPGGYITVYAGQFANVTRGLLNEGANPRDPQLGLRITTMLSREIGDLTSGLASAIKISLPDLDAGTTTDIIADNVRALAPHYFASQLEELQFFRVGDKVIEHFMSGMVPISRGPGADKLYAYVKDTPNRFTEVERRNFYERAFGTATGQVSDGVIPNQQFQDAWIRFLSAVSIFNRQSDSQLQMVTGEQAIKAARDLAVNLSYHGFGIFHPAATELQKLINTVKDMLSTTEILSAYGVRDCFQLVDRVSTLYLGGTSGMGVRYRTTAQSGARIMLWLADNAPVLASVTTSSLANAEKLFQDTVDPYSKTIIKQNTLRLDVERWLAVTATVDQTVTKFSEPTDMPSTSVPTLMQPQAMLPDQLRGMLNNIGNMTGNLTGNLNGGMLPTIPGAMPSPKTN